MRRVFLVAMIVGMLSGCGPRGETRTLDEVLQREKARFAATQGGADSKVASRLAELRTKLDDLAFADKELTPKAFDIAEALNGMLYSAGYTSRPGLSELISQFRLLDETGDPKLDRARAKLLVARTFGALAAELETTKFAL